MGAAVCLLTPISWEGVNRVTAPYFARDFSPNEKNHLSHKSQDVAYPMDGKCVLYFEQLGNF